MADNARDVLLGQKNAIDALVKDIEMGKIGVGDTVQRLMRMRIKILNHVSDMPKAPLPAKRRRLVRCEPPEQACICGGDGKLWCPSCAAEWEL